jgi:uncharacterized protein (TIGR02266 family)
MSNRYTSGSSDETNGEAAGAMSAAMPGSSSRADADGADDAAELASGTDPAAPTATPTATPAPTPAPDGTTDTDTDSEADRRVAQRLEVHLTARYSSGAISLSGWVANLSRHGLFLRSEFLDTTGARAELDVSIPGEPGPVKVAGEVVRVVEAPGRSGMGIRFREIDPCARRKLANFMIERSFRAAR